MRLPINVQESLGFNSNLQVDEYTLEAQPLPDGKLRVARMTTTPSRHRCMLLVDLDEGGRGPPEAEDTEYPRLRPMF